MRRRRRDFFKCLHPWDMVDLYCPTCRIYLDDGGAHEPLNPGVECSEPVHRCRMCLRTVERGPVFWGFARVRWKSKR